MILLSVEASVLRRPGRLPLPARRPSSRAQIATT